MKFGCAASREVWHRWFAWKPIRVGENDCRWLEYVERKGTYWACWGHSGWTWEYRTTLAPEQDK